MSCSKESKFHPNVAEQIGEAVSWALLTALCGVDGKSAQALVRADTLQARAVSKKLQELSQPPGETTNE